MYNTGIRRILNFVSTNLAYFSPPRLFFCPSQSHRAKKKCCLYPFHVPVRDDDVVCDQFLHRVVHYVRSLWNLFDALDVGRLDVKQAWAFLSYLSYHLGEPVRKVALVSSKAVPSKPMPADLGPEVGMVWSILVVAHKGCGSSLFCFLSP